MSNLCSDSVLTGQEGTILFTPPGTSVCVRDWSPFVETSNRIYLQCGASFAVSDKVQLTEEDGGNIDSGITAGDDYVVSSVGTGAAGDVNAAGDDMEGVPYIVLTGVTIAGDGGVGAAGGVVSAFKAGSTAFPTGTNYDTDVTYKNVKTEAQGGSTGKGLTVQVVLTATGTINALASITVDDGGSGYKADDVIVIKGSELGGTDGTHDVNIKVQTASAITKADSALPAHINIALSEYQSVCGVRDFSIDISRDELDVTTLPCGEDTAKGCEDLAEFRKTQAGYASATGSMTVYFTCDQANISNRLLSSSISKSQQGAKVKLYVCATYEGGTLVDSKSLYIEADISITGLSFSVNPDDATTAELSFGVRKMTSVFGKT